MFKKKKNKQEILEEEVKVATSKDEIEVIEEEVKVATSKDAIEVIEEEVEVVLDINMDDELVEEIPEETEELVVGNFTYHDSDPNNECSVDDDETLDVVESERDDKEDNKDKKKLSSYFEDSKKDNSKIKETPIKETRKSKRLKNKEADFYRVKNQKVFVFRNKKYFKVEDFIKYLNSHYLEIDKISQEVLDDENFYGWLSKKSGVFEDSIKQFKEIKEKIEKK